MKQILLVEDDPSLSKIIDQRLTEEGHIIKTAHSVSTATSALKESAYDLAIIDIGLPDGDGFTLAQEIKTHHSIPFIFLTAMGSPEYRLEGYELGAADYIPKPFHFKELSLRIKKILGEKIEPKTLSSGTLTLDPQDRTVSDGASLHETLGIREFQLLYHLIKLSPRLISRSEALQSIWNITTKPNPRTVDNAVLKLRTVLGSKYSEYLRSVRGAGYQWVES